MKLKTQFIYLTLLVLFVVPASTYLVFAQEKDNVKAEMFRQVDAKFEQAKNEDVPKLSPRQYPKALQLYRRAEEEYDKGERVKKIRQRIDEALAVIEKAIESAAISRVALADLLATRQQATAKREYIDLVPKEFVNAERKYGEAVAQAEKGDIKSAKKKGDEAIRLYREMIIKALLEGPIKTAEAELKNSRKKMSKDEYKKAERELKTLKKSTENAKKTEFGISEYDAKVLAQINRIVSMDKSSPNPNKEMPAPASPSASVQPNQVIANQPSLTAQNPINQKLTLLGNSAALGAATTPVQSTPNGTGRFQHFQNGSIYWSSQTGAHLVRGESRDKWLSLGGESSLLGFPTSDEEIAPDGAKITRFQHGVIRWTNDRGARIELNVVTLPRKVITR